MTQISDDETPSILLLSRGWNHDGWANEFYPDDLPQDWRLSYYANEFQAVLVSESDWLNGDDYEEWLEDVHEEFRFYIELTTDPGDKSGRLQQIVDRLGSRFAGLIVDVGGNQLVSLSTEDLQQLSAIVPAGSDMNMPNNGAWADNEETQVADEMVKAFVFKAKGRYSLADMRKIADMLHQRAKSGDPALMIFAGEDPDIRMMQDCRIMLNLMGIA